MDTKNLVSSNDLRTIGQRILETLLLFDKSPVQKRYFSFFLDSERVHLDEITAFDVQMPRRNFSPKRQKSRHLKSPYPFRNRLLEWSGKRGSNPRPSAWK